MTLFSVGLSWLYIWRMLKVLVELSDNHTPNVLTQTTWNVSLFRKQEQLGMWDQNIYVTHTWVGHGDQKVIWHARWVEVALALLRTIQTKSMNILNTFYCTHISEFMNVHDILISEKTLISFKFPGRTKE